jgi:hypothetical protein
MGPGALLENSQKKEYAFWLGNLFGSSEFAPATKQEAQAMSGIQSDCISYCCSDVYVVPSLVCNQLRVQLCETLEK